MARMSANGTRRVTRTPAGWAKTSGFWIGSETELIAVDPPGATVWKYGPPVGGVIRSTFVAAYPERLTAIAVLPTPASMLMTPWRSGGIGAGKSWTGFPAMAWSNRSGPRRTRLPAFGGGAVGGSPTIWRISAVEPTPTWTSSPSVNPFRASTPITVSPVAASRVRLTVVVPAPRPIRAKVVPAG
jgi:hypothetical protein